MRHPLFGPVLLTAGICGLTALGGIASLSLAAAGPGAAPPAASTTVAPPADPHWGMLQQYCSKCHNADDWAGGIAFDTMSPQDIGNDAKIWEHAMVKLRGRLMPPPGNPQPPNEQIHTFVSYMENSLDAAAAHQVDAPKVA